MATIYKHFMLKILQFFPLILLFLICIKDDSLFHFKFFDLLSFNFQYIIIYYWVLKNPQILGYGFIFLAGIITDVILGLPIGISSLSFLTVALVATYIRIVTVKITLLVDWLTFIPALLAANLIYFLVLYFNDIYINYLNLLTTSLSTFIIYPLVWGLFEVFRRFVKVSTHD